MKKILYTLFTLVLLIFSYASANAEVWEDAKHRKWNISHVGYGAVEDGNYYGFAENIINVTKTFLNSYEDVENNLGELESMVQGSLCGLCAYGTIYGGRDGGDTNSRKYIKLGCSNHLLATFEYACPDIPPTFSCEDLIIKGNGVYQIANDQPIYASESIRISQGLKVNSVGEYDCKKYTADKVKITLTGDNGKTGEYVGKVPEKLSNGFINLDGRDIVVRTNVGETVTDNIGTYKLKFDVYNDKVGKGWFSTNTCEFKIIANDTKDCGVASDGSNNGNGNGKLDPGEQCEYDPSGKKIGVGVGAPWGDKDPQCSSCQLVNYCGDGVINNNEECEQGLPETWGAGGCNPDCKKINGDCLNDTWQEEKEACDPTDKPEGYPNAGWYNNGLSNKGWGTGIDGGIGCSQECEPLGEKPGIQVEKYSSNDDDLDPNKVGNNQTNDTQTIVSGTKAEFRIVVKNTGEENLKNITITDEQSADCKGTLIGGNVGNNPVEFSGGNNNNDDILEPGESFSYTCEEPIVKQGFQNIAVVTGVGTTSGYKVTTQDKTNVLIDGLSIDILKYSGNPNDLDSVTEPSNATNDSQTVLKNTKAVFEIVVTNYGTGDLENITIEDEKAPNCATKQGTYVNLEKKYFVSADNDRIVEIRPYLDPNVNNVLIPGESFTYKCDKDGTPEGGYINTATVTGTNGTNTVTVTDTDYTEIKIGQSSNISVGIEKYSGNNDDQDNNKNTNDPDNDSQTINSGEKAIFKIRITNNGNEDLENLEIRDHRSPDCEGKLENGKINGHTVTGNNGNNGNDILEVNETIEYTCKEYAVTQGFRNKATVTGHGITTGTSTSTSNGTNVIVKGGSIDILKYSGNPDDLDEETYDNNENDIQVIRTGEDAVFKIVVTNYGDKKFKNIEIKDANASDCETNGYVDLSDEMFRNKDGQDISIHLSGNNNNFLEPGEWFSYTCRKELETDGDTYINKAIVKAEKIGGGGGGGGSIGINVDDDDETKVVKLVCNPNGTLEPNNEVCDPEDYDEEKKWGDAGCSQECLPIDELVVTTCSNIDIEDDYTNEKTLKTGMTCYGNSDVKTFKLDCGDGSAPIFAKAQNYAGAKKGVFKDGENCYDSQGNTVNCECSYDYDLDKSSAFNAKCSVSEKSNNENPNDSSWKTNYDCQDTVSIWSKVDPPCKELKAKGWNIVCNDDDDDDDDDDEIKIKTFPGGWSYTEPTFANNSDTKMVCLHVTDEYGNDIELDYFDFMAGISKVGFFGNGDYEDNIGAEFLINGLNINQVDKNSGYIEGVKIEAAAMIQSHVCVLMKSVVPGKKKFNFELYIPRHTETFPLMWNGNYRIISGESSMEIEFKKPFVGQFKVTDETGWSSEIGRSVPKINTYQQYQVLPILQKACRDGEDCKYYDGALNIKLSNNGGSSKQNATADDTVINITDKHKFGEYDGIDNDLKNCKENKQKKDEICGDFLGGFYARIDATTNEAALKTPKIQSQKMTISYRLGDKSVKYYLTQENDGDDDTEFELEGLPDIKSLGLKVIGTAQWDGKGLATGQDDNFSDISELDQRAAIKANANGLVNGMTPGGNPVNGVRYVKNKDYKIIGENIDFKTLVVKNGNVIITSNIEGNTNIGIIVINDDNYYSKNVDGLYKYGNVFINSDVTKINAMIYADGGIISSDTNGNPLVKNSVARTADLQNQLWLKGAVFTRNTVGGAFAGGTEYKLPGGEVTTSFNEAMIYDLNYTRSNSSGSVVGYEDYSFIIEFNSNLQANPPKGFGK